MQLAGTRRQFKYINMLGIRNEYRKPHLLLIQCQVFWP